MRRSKGRIKQCCATDVKTDRAHQMDPTTDIIVGHGRLGKMKSKLSLYSAQAVKTQLKQKAAGVCVCLPVRVEGSSDTN